MIIVKVVSKSTKKTFKTSKLPPPSNNKLFDKPEDVQKLFHLAFMNLKVLNSTRTDRRGQNRFSICIKDGDRVSYY